MKLKTFFLATLVILFSINASQAAIVNKTLQVGSSDAPVVMYVFYSLSCPACAQFHKGVVSKIETDFVANNKLRIVFVSYPIFPQTDYFAHSLIHSIKDTKISINLINTLLHNQSKWRASKNPVNEITNYALLMGVSKADIEKATNNQEIIDWFAKSRSEYQALGITATPTTFLSNKADSVFKYKHKFVGGVDYKTLSKAIDEMAK